LVGKYGREYGFYEKKCDGGNFFETDDKCMSQCYNNGKIWKVEDYGFVGEGKYYGSTNE
jgi:hypothetical protein